VAHRTARLNEYGRQLLVQRIVIEGWTVPTAAKAQGISRVPNAPAAGAATLPGGGYWPLPHAEHVAVGVLEPRTASRTDLGDEVDRPSPRSWAGRRTDGALVMCRCAPL